MNTSRQTIPDRSEQLSLLLAVLLVLLIATLAYRSYAAFERSSQQLEASQRLVDGTDRLLSLLKDAETGQRGYLLTGEGRYLDPYASAVTQVPAALDSLAGGEAIEQLRPLIAEKLDELKETIEARRDRGFDAALAIVRTDHGKSVMDRIRTICAETRSAANARLILAAEEARTSTNQVAVISTAGSGALLVLLIFSTLTIRSSNRRRTALIQQLLESEDRLSEGRDWLQTTLASIGDAVIATDQKGNITFLNAVAQQLTGFTEAEAVGKMVSQVFVIRQEKTGAAVESPTERAIREEKVVALANHTVLITKDGRRIPIEDTAAPIRDGQSRIIGAVLVFRDVAVRREVEEASERNEERLKLALDAGQIGVWDWDVASNRIEWSDRVYDIHGVEPGKFPGRVEDFAKLIHPEDQERISEAITAALQGAPYEVEFRVIHPNGKIAWVSTTGVVLKNDHGEPLRMLGATTDITARKQAETQLRQQWYTFDTALSNTPDFTYIFDLKGRFTYVNRALLSLWQKPLEEALHKNFFDLGYPDELAARLQTQIQMVADTGQPVRDQTPFTGPTGETRFYEYIFVPVLDADGRIQAVAGSTRDVTDRSRAEEALRISEERLTLALEAGGGVGTWDWDVPGDRIYCNAQFAKLYSIDPECAATGAPLAAFLNPVHADDRERIAKALALAIQTGGELSEEHRLLQQDGSVRWVHARGRCHRDEAGKASRFPGVLFDITELKRAEEELRRSNEELTRANRELEEFAYVASHDLQEPLRMVNIYTQLILRQIGPEQTKVAPYADFVQQGVTRMEVLIHDLLTFSRTVHSEELQVGTADLSTSFAEALSVLKNRIEESGAVVTVPETLPTVRGEDSQMAHVFQNLLSNALKYRKADVRPEIRVSAKREGKDWVVSVRDNGIGFEPKYAERIFGLFKRLHKDDYPGTGLGLAICKRIVERYGGSIWAEATSGAGATFHFSLPAAEGVERVANSAS